MSIVHNRIVVLCDGHLPWMPTRSASASELLAPKVNCLYFTASDPDSRTDAVRHLAKDAPLRRRLVESGFSTAWQLTTGRLGDDLEARLTAATNGSPSRRRD